MEATLTNAMDTYYPAIAVAALDLLGVRALVSRSDCALTAMDVLSRFVRNASTRGVYNTETLHDRHDFMFDVDVFFGDSLYLFADPSRDIETQVHGLLLRVSTLIGIGLWTSPRFLVRGAIAVGDLRKRLAQGDSVSHEIRIGTSMINAHQLQEGQDWIGAAVHPDTPLNAEARKWTTTNEVPLKPGFRLEGTPVAVNWVWSKGTPEEVESHLERAVRETGAAGGEACKLENTREFVKLAIATRQFAPFILPQG